MKSSKIQLIKAREILDSRGKWTLEVDLKTSFGVFCDSAPSGASKGKYEAKTVDAKTAVRNVNKIVGPKLKGKDVKNQKEIDKLLEKLNVGANTTTAVSMVVARAAAAAQNLPLYKYISRLYGSMTPVKLPRPAFNIINGGVHAENDLDFQEFMVVPEEKTFLESLKQISKIYQELRQKLGKNVGDEGGFAPPLQNPEQALELIKDSKIIIDAAASQFYREGRYKMKFGIFTSEGMIRYYQGLIKKYPIIGLEDPFAEADFASWQKFKSNILVIGDDLLVTNPQRIRRAKEKNLCNALLLKVNQVGNLTQALEAARLARSFNWKIIVSHRSGETNDDFIADLAVGIGADFIKAGAPARGERVAKYNRLLRIEEEIKNRNYA
jgi:enolase